jgi:hypothetical protein
VISFLPKPPSCIIASLTLSANLAKSSAIYLISSETLVTDFWIICWQNS